MNTKEKSAEKKKILIIDDDKIFTKILTDTIPKEKFVTSVAFDGESGLDMYRTEKPDIVILDLKMPKMSGIDFLNTLKKEKASLEVVPILIASQLSSMADISEAITAGIDVGVKGYIIKATENMEMIVQTIEKNLSDQSITEEV